jgi:hypothetical protein
MAANTHKHKSVLYCILHHPFKRTTIIDVGESESECFERRYLIFVTLAPAMTEPRT